MYSNSNNNFYSGEDDAVDNILRVSEVNCFQRVLRFYEAPFTKFVTNVVSCIIFLRLSNFYLKPLFCIQCSLPSPRLSFKP